MIIFPGSNLKSIEMSSDTPISQCPKSRFHKPSVILPLTLSLSSSTSCPPSMSHTDFPFICLKFAYCKL